jgi:signal transduction histidine kinase
VLLVKTLQSSTLRLALLYIGFFAAAIIGLFGYVYWSTVFYVRNTLEQEISREHAFFWNSYKHGGRDELITTINSRIAGTADGGWSYLLVDNAFGRIAGDLSHWPLTPSGDSGRGVFVSSEHAGAELRAEYRTLPDGAHLLAARLDTSNGFVATITTGLVCAVAFMILLATAAGISTSRRSVARIEAINTTSRAIMRSGLGQRIPRRGTGDEWDGLADNLNSMLDRIGELVETNRQVSDNIAHDLRTPLTRVRGRLEQAYNQPYDATRYHASLSDTIAELDNVLKIFSSLLRISRIEAKAQRAAFSQVDLLELAREVVGLFEPMAEEKGTALRLGNNEAVSILGDRDLLFDALSNLIDNAIKYGGSDGVVTVQVRGSGGNAPVLVVSDLGPGIPPGEQINVLKRFYRLEKSRSTPGNGLGLSLVEAVAHLHEARVEFTDNRPGLKVELRFPSAAIARSDDDECPAAA